MMRRLMLGSLTTALLLTLAGCGGDTTSTGAEPTASPTVAEPSGSESTSDDPSATPTDADDAPPAPAPVVPSVAPATGPLFTGPTVSVNAPVEAGDMPVKDEIGGSVFNIEDLRYSFVLRDIPWTTTEVSGLAEEALDGTVTDVPLERKPDVVIAGRPAYHVAGPDPKFDGWLEEFGFHHAGNRVIIAVNTPTDVPQAERDAMNAAVIASVKLLK